MAAQDPLIGCDHPARQMAQALRNSAEPLALGPQRLPLDRCPVTGCAALACGRGVLSTTSPPGESTRQGEARNGFSA